MGSAAELVAALSNGLAHVMLRPGVYDLTDAMCSNGTLCLTQSVVIEAEEAGTVVLDAKGTNRVVYIATGVEAQLHGLNITGGAADSGGGLDNHGRAHLSRCNIYNNSVSGSGGGLFSRASWTLQASTFTNLTFCSIFENVASGAAGAEISGSRGVYAYVEISDSNIYRNTAVGSGGGGLMISYDTFATLKRCDIYGNSAPHGAGL